MSESTRLQAFLAMCVARFREFYRESEVVFWSFGFPIILSVGLGVAFRSRPAEVLPVAVADGAGAAAVATSLGGSSLLKVLVLPPAEAAHALRMGRVALVVVPAGEASVTYRLDPARPDSALARSRADDALQRAAGRRDVVAGRDEAVSEPGARYIDFLIPGILAMNLMSGGMWGVGFNLVDMRMKRLLKRLIATPMRRTDFMAAQMSVRILAMALEMAFVLGLGHVLFGVPVRGSLTSVFLVGALGALCFGGLGILVGARSQKIEGVMGLMNALMMPMFVCSGIFFSYERFPEFLLPAIRVLPLTALADALRAVVLEGASLASQASQLLVLGVWGGVSFVLGLRFFRWS